MGDMDIVPVMGGTTNFMFPILLVIMSICNFFDVYPKILSAFGMG
jgi:hypothetical protein